MPVPRVEASCAPVDPAAIDDHHDLFVGFAEGRHHLMDIWRSSWASKCGTILYLLFTTIHFFLLNGDMELHRIGISSFKRCSKDEDLTGKDLNHSVSYDE